MNGSADALVLPNTPAAFSIGRKCIDEGYGHVWPPRSTQPYMYMAHSQKVREALKNFEKAVEEEGAM